MQLENTVNYQKNEFLSVASKNLREFVIFFDAMMALIWGGNKNNKPKKPKIKRDSDQPYCDKGDHAERSKGNDDRPNGHKWWWKKKEKKEKYEKKREEE